MRLSGKYFLLSKSTSSVRQLTDIPQDENCHKWSDLFQTFSCKSFISDNSLFISYKAEAVSAFKGQPKQC